MVSCKSLRTGLWIKTVAAAICLLAASVPVMAQGGGGGGAGGGGGGGGSGGGGGGGSSSSSSSSGSTSLIMGGSSTGSATVGQSGSRGGSTVTIQSPISTTDLFSGYYASPTSAGLAANVTLQSQQAISLASSTSGSSSTGGGTSTSTGASNNLNAILTKKGTFGSPEFTNIYANVQNSTGTGTTNTQTAGSGFTTIGVKRTPQYSTQLEPEMMVRGPSLEAVRSNVQAALQNSISLPSGPNLAVFLDGQTLVLRGNVATDRERRIAEGLVQLTPGVPAVRNEINVVGGQAP